VKDVLTAAFQSTKKALSLDHLGFEGEERGISINDLFSVLTRSVAQKQEDGQSIEQRCALPNVITFPYSRHSSLFESRDLVGAFRPLDVYPCTVDESQWKEGKSQFKPATCHVPSTGTHSDNSIS
jgi:DNA cross-link repair 1C protein